jgi:hypothetical protein
MKTQKLSALAKTIRSKNAGVNLITFDIIFAERATYDRVKRARVLTRETVCKLYGIPDKRVSDFVEFDPGNAIKFTLYRLRPSGSPGDPDIFGAQQYAPLLDVEVPGAQGARRRRCHARWQVVARAIGRHGA